MIHAQTHKLAFTSNDKQRIFFTSDTHFNHANIIKYCNRPFENVEEMNEALIKNWNSKVRPEDLVFHLGDFMLGNAANFWYVRSRLNGQIILVMGNHDWGLIETMPGNFEDAFRDVYNELAININGQKMYLNHKPFLCFDGSYKEKKPTWQLFGHIHTQKDTPPTPGDRMRSSVLFPTQYDVGVDNNDYTPVSFEEVNAIIANQIQKSINK